MAAATPQRPACSDYRGQMLLLSLHRRLCEAGLTDEERIRISHCIQRLESELGMD